LADAALVGKERWVVEAEKNMVTPVPQELDLLAVLLGTAEVDLLTRWWCSVPQVAEMLQIQPAENNVN
jgi:hypothetical protein